jgi:hypothetical protein
MGTPGGGRPCPLCGFEGGALPQAASVPTIKAKTNRSHNTDTSGLRDDEFRRNVMGLIVLEALGALLLLVLIVWWTMFSGRKGGEPPAQQLPAPEDEKKP